MPDERWTFLNMNDQADKQTEPYRFFGTQEEGIVGKRDLSYDDAPIGVFDSGFGGLTVAREIMKALETHFIALMALAHSMRLLLSWSRLAPGLWIRV